MKCTGRSPYISTVIASEPHLQACTLQAQLDPAHFFKTDPATFAQRTQLVVAALQMGYTAN
jgi:hypothetical protein